MAARARARISGFWDGYLKSLKPLEVEEPIDVWVHRPLGYLIARLSLPTPISPNLITLMSIAFGLTAATCIVVPFDGHLPLAGLCLFLSAVCDCADGQLARLRGTSSAFGRMLDGAADLIVTTGVVVGGAWLVWSRHHDTWWIGAAMLALCGATIVTGSFHTAMYDHYKNVYLWMTTPNFREGEDYASALARFHQRKGDSWFTRLAWLPYLFYVKSQMRYLARFDPYTVARFSDLPSYGPITAAVYREHAGRVMQKWRSLFGFGSLVFGMAVSIAFDVVEYYAVFRLVLLNAVYYGHMRPEQRRASQAAFAKLAPRPEAEPALA